MITEPNCKKQLLQKPNIALEHHSERVSSILCDTSSPFIFIGSKNQAPTILGDTRIVLWFYVPRTVLSCSERRPPTATGLMPQPKLYKGCWRLMVDGSWEGWWMLMVAYSWATHLTNRLFHVLWKFWRIPLFYILVQNVGKQCFFPWQKEKHNDLSHSCGLKN